MDDRMRRLLRDRAEDIPTFREMPPRLKTRARRRVALTFGAAFVAVTVLVVGAFAGINAIRSVPVPADRPTPSPAPGVLRVNGEVLNFTGDPRLEAPGDLVAVNPETREERVLVEDLDLVYSARWSADGRWVAYETPAGDGVGLWVVGASQEPRQVATDVLAWGWSSTGAHLATAPLSTIDPVTGETSDLGSIPERVAEVTSAPALSPDGTRFVFGARGGALYSIDAPSGARLLVRLPGEHLDSVDEILWSPDGAHIAVMNDLEPGGVDLYVMNADGSNVRVLADNYDPAGVAWSPDGTRLAYAHWSAPDRKVGVSVAPMDGAGPAEIGSLVASCRFAYTCDLTWSPDGSMVAFRAADGAVGVVSAIDADGSGDPESIDELTYRSWDGGWYSCECR